MRGPQQKNMSRMKDLLRKYTRPENVVLDFCARTCSAAKACMLPDQHKKFVGCDVDSELLNAADKDLVVMFLAQVLSSTLDIGGSAEVVAAVKVFKDEKAAVLARKKAGVW